jgi:hypothetical protein
MRNGIFIRCGSGSVIRIPIPVLFDPCIRNRIWDSGKKKLQIRDPESGINLWDHISDSLIKILGLKAVLWIRIQHFK